MLPAARIVRVAGRVVRVAMPSVSELAASVVREAMALVTGCG